MAKKTQSTQMKTAYGQRFSQEDLTSVQDENLPEQLRTPSYKDGGLPMLVALARNRGVKFSGGGSRTTKSMKERKVV